MNRPIKPPTNGDDDDMCDRRGSKWKKDGIKEERTGDEAERYAKAPPYYRYDANVDDGMRDRRGSKWKKHGIKEEGKGEEAEGYAQPPPYYQYDAFLRNKNTKKRGKRQDNNEEQEEEKVEGIIEEEAEEVNSDPVQIAGAFAVSRQGAVRRGGDDDVITTISELPADPMPPPPPRPPADPEILVHANVVDEDENPPLPLAPTEPAQVATVIDQARVRKRRRRIIWGVALLVVLVIVAIVVVMLLINNNDSGGGDENNSSLGGNENNSSPPPTTTSPTPSPTTRSPTLPPTQTPTNPIVLLPDGPWQPMGQVVNGTAASGRFGSPISLSRDGSVMAVGATGYVSVLQFNQATKEWTPMGQDLVGQANDDSFGGSVSLNGDGTILAVGADTNDSSGGEGSGRVQVYEYNSGTDRWNQLGSAIDGEDVGDNFGVSVSLNDVGDILAAGAPYDETINGWGAGSVRLFQYNRDVSLWQQLGQTLLGQAETDYFGRSVSLSRSGVIVAAGTDDSDFNGDEAGQVSVYEYNSATSSWDLLGDPIYGQVREAGLGKSLCLDDSGLVVAVGAPWSYEFVLVYDYDHATSTWTQRGQSILTQQLDDDFGSSVSLSGNGNTVAVGSPSHVVNGLAYVGQVAIFQYDATSDDWIQVGERLDGEAEGDEFGYSVSLSANGTVVGVGANQLAYAFTVF